MSRARQAFQRQSRFSLPGAVHAARSPSDRAGRLTRREISADGSAALTRFKSDLNVTCPVLERVVLHLVAYVHQVVADGVCKHRL
jgi:hypothetical protein